MVNSRLIMLEGLPSTGKTTNARFIHIQLERSGINAKWIHEVAVPHPVLFFDEIGLTCDEYERFIKTYPKAADGLSNAAIFKKSTVGINLLELEWHYKDKIGEDAYQALLKFDTWQFPLEKYKKFALEKWEHFTKQALENGDEVYVIDSAIFQYQIFRFLFDNKSSEELQSFISQIINIIRPLNPHLIFLRRENTEATIGYLENNRGTEYLEYIQNRDKAWPYYEDKPPGAESFKQFLRDYAGMADLLFKEFPLNKISLEISDGNWTCHENEMLSFLDIARISSPDFFPPDGIYKNESPGFVIKVDGLSITDPTGKERKLFPKSSNEFYVDWLPTVLRFEENKIIISGSQVAERWTVTGTEFDKIRRKFF